MKEIEEMYGLNQLKEKLIMTADKVECPVKDCNVIVTRQRNTFRKHPDFFCDKHRIYISPTTFAYDDKLRNLLWKDGSDVHLLDRINEVKRENRMAHNNSEDSLIWNVFRFLEKRNLQGKIIEMITGRKINNAELVYWSYSQTQKQAWDMLVKAREEFELVPSKGSEPDLIAVTDTALIIIEAKLTASNNSGDRIRDMKNKNPQRFLMLEKKYTEGGEGWWKQVFKSEFSEIAIKDRLYELARFWLIGSWMAERMGVDFYLINLVLDRKEKDIEQRIGPHIIQTDRRTFKRLTWENLFSLIQSCDKNGYAQLHKYLINMSIGYDQSKQVLQPAFSLEHNGL